MKILSMLNLLYAPDAGGEGGGGGGGGSATLITGGGGEGGGGGGTGQQQQQQGAIPEWVTKLTDPALRESKSLARFQNPEASFKAYLEAEKALGSRVAIPGEKATAEERATFYNRLGRPESADKYDISATKVPENIPVDKEFQTAALAKMHESGLTQTQASGLYDFYMQHAVGNVTSSAKEVENKRAANKLELQKEYGKDYDGNMKLAYQAVKKFGGQPILDWLDKSGLGDNPNIARLFVNIGKALGEDIASGSGDGGFNKGKQTEALAEIEKIKKDPESAAIFKDSQHPKNKELSARWKSLHEVAYPGKVTE